MATARHVSLTKLAGKIGADVSRFPNTVKILRRATATLNFSAARLVVELTSSIRRA